VKSLSKKLREHPGLGINHILEDIDRQVNEVEMVAESVGAFLKRANKVYWKFANVSIVVAALLFFFGDVILNAVSGYPETTMLTSIRVGPFAPFTLILPSLLALATLVIGSLAYSKIAFRQLKKKAVANGAEFLVLDTDYRKNLWEKMSGKAKENLEALGPYDLWRGYGRSLTKIQNFLNNDLKKYYEKIIT